MHLRTVLSTKGANTGIEVPADALAALGAGRRPAVVVTVAGHTYRSTVGTRDGVSLIPFSAARRRETGLEGGETIDVELTLDTGPRTVEVPADLVAALDAEALRPAFDALSPSRRRAHVDAVEGAKAEATRARRIVAVVTAVRG